MAWTVLRTLALVTIFVTGKILTGVLIPTLACQMSPIFYLPSTAPAGEIDVSSDVAQLLLGLIFLFQLQFAEFLIFQYLIETYEDNFELQTMIIECLHIANYARGCMALTFLMIAARTGAILDPTPRPWEAHAYRQQQASSFSPWSRREEQPRTWDEQSSVTLTNLGYFVVSFSYVITNYFALEFSEERIIFRLFQLHEHQNFVNNNNAHHHHHHHHHHQ